MSDKKIRLSLDVSPELNGVLDDMAQTNHSSKSEVLKKAIALMEVALAEKKSGNGLAVIREGKILKEIIGL